MTDREKQHDEFVRLLAANTKRLYAYIRTLVMANENDAEEIFQNTCVTIWHKFGEYDPSGNFGAWACRMAYYEVLLLYNTKNRVRFFSEEALAALADAALPISERINERREALADCLGKLAQDDKSLIESRYFDGLSARELADSSNCSVHAIYRTLNRVHGLLLRCVERSMVGGGAS